MTPTRDLLFVKDTARGFEAIAKSKVLIGHEVNIATNSEVSIGDVANTLISLINPQAKIVLDETRLRPSKSEVFRLFGDNSKIIKHTNWSPNYTLSEGLQETIEWFSNKNNLKNYKANIYNV